ncbi:MAG TPA: hypothetical protein VGH44_01755 [Candidatus Saccharimonadia bacterium]|jgi:glycogen debranching enzyme
MSHTFTWLTHHRLELALDRVKSDQGVAASDWALFRGAIFGRDSLIVALDLLETHPGLVQCIILSLARLQGTHYEALTEEEPGKIHHEHRTLFHNGRRLKPDAANLVARIAQERSIGSGEGFTYYGTVDATVQFVRVVAAFVRQYGPELLDHTFEHRDGGTRTVRDSLLAAVDWTAGQVESSALGLLEFRRTNPHGLKWHVLRDGTASYVHSDGQLANTTAPVASLEVQGLAYDALLDAAELFPSHRESATWRALASRLRLHTLLLFWMPQHQYFAMGIDRDAENRPRHLEVITGMPGELLDTRFFDDLPRPYDRRRLLEPIVRHLYASDLMTPVGPRMRSLRHADILPYTDYQGSYTSWPVITGIIARGLLRQGFEPLARDLEHRLLTGLDRVQACAEFIYVDAAGRPAVRSYAPRSGRAEFFATNLPELRQAWTVSAALRAARHLSGPQSGRWEKTLSVGILSKQTAQSRVIRPMQVHVNQIVGRLQEADYLELQGYGYEIAKAPWLQPAPGPS